MVIDTHQHFWRFTEDEFDWIGDDMASIRHDFDPEDLATILKRNKVDGVITVQSRQKEIETRWLLQLSQQHKFIRGVVGWVDLKSPKVSDQLAEFAEQGPLVGVRHVLQGEPDEFMADADFNRGISSLKNQELVYDILITERQLPSAIALVDRHPDQPFVLDHFGKPRIGENELEPWAANIKKLAQRQNVWCKVSGGITEAFLAWTPARLKPYLDVTLAAFGPKRLIFGSNWPVCEAAGGYGKWIDAMRQWSSSLSLDERGSLFGKTAEELYQL